jgi:hypothetical protein
MERHYRAGEHIIEAHIEYRQEFYVGERPAQVADRRYASTVSVRGPRSLYSRPVPQCNEGRRPNGSFGFLLDVFLRYEGMPGRDLLLLSDFLVGAVAAVLVTRLRLPYFASHLRWEAIAVAVSQGAVQ